MNSLYQSTFWEPRNCFLEPIPEMYLAAELLSKAVDAILEGNLSLASELIVAADIAELEMHNAKIAGSMSTEIQRLREIPSAPRVEKVKTRMPSRKVELSIYERDGWHCRFCNVPVVSKDVRKRLNKLFPDAARWGSKNIEKHRALSILESSLDHITPHSRGGDNSLLNLVTACGPCQFGRGGWTIEEVGINNPLSRAPVLDGWDGLRRLLRCEVTS